MEVVQAGAWLARVAGDSWSVEVRHGGGGHLDQAEEGHETEEEGEQGGEHQHHHQDLAETFRR